MRTRTIIASGIAALALTAAGCGGGETETASYSVEPPPSSATTNVEASTEATAHPKKEPKVDLPAEPATELGVEDIKEGKGPAAKKGDMLSIAYVGFGQKTKKKFDSSYESGSPIEVAIGEGQVIKGWDEGIVGMKVGGRRKLVIPGDMAYGAAGRPPSIKPNETLVFVVDLLEIQ